jgi:hypothetical protein
VPDLQTALARRHPCLPCLLGWIALLSLPIAAAVVSDTPALLVFAVPPLVWVALLGSAVAEGRPEHSLADGQRLDAMLKEVGGFDAFLVGARDDLDWPVHRRGHIVIGATDFLRHASDEVLRGVAALQHAVPTRPCKTRWLDGTTVVLWVSLFGSGMVATAMAHGAAGPLPAFSPLGFCLWLIVAGRAAWLALKIRPETYARQDRRAAELAGDPRHVADALLAMRTWRRMRDKQVPVLVRWCRALLQPIAPGDYELERAGALSKQAN